MNLRFFKFGFTLAETLITITILGLIVAITVPVLVRRFQDMTQISAMKRAYAMIDNALQEMYVIEGPPSTWNDWTTTNNSQANSNLFASKLVNYLPVQKYCGSNYGCSLQTCKLNNSGRCGGGNAISGQEFYTTLTGKKNLWGNWTDANVYGKMLLKNGMMLAVHMRESNASVWNYFNDDLYKSWSGYRGFTWCNYIRVDINGKKGPNRYGYDVFFFIPSDSGLVLPQPSDKSFCVRNSDGYQNGQSCYAWVLKHNNMDYKYRNVNSEW